MTNILERVKNEPVLLIAVLQAVIILAVAFGADLSVEQRDAMIGAAVALMSLAFGVRTRVTPVRKLPMQFDPEAVPPRDWTNV